ncbi:MAG: hypothetical protein FWD88_00245 [Treponema sp.]|nr:hypothetical protein [Treponema sp.]
MKKRFAKAAGIAAVLVVALAFFTGCPAGDPVINGPQIEPEAWVFDDFNHAAPGRIDPEYGWNAPIHIGYWAGGVSLGAYVFDHEEPPHAPAGIHLTRVSAYHTPHPENAWGREFPTPRPVPAGSTGISFWVFEEGTDDDRDAELLEVSGTWLFTVGCVDGNTATAYFTITEVGVRQQFQLLFPAGFGNAVAEYMFFMRPTGDYVPGVAPPDGSVSGGLHFTQMRFINPNEPNE